MCQTLRVLLHRVSHPNYISIHPADSLRTGKDEVFIKHLTIVWYESARITFRNCLSSVALACVWKLLSFRPARSTYTSAIVFWCLIETLNGNFLSSLLCSWFFFQLQHKQHSQCPIKWMRSFSQYNSTSAWTRWRRTEKDSRKSQEAQITFSLRGFIRE